MMQNSQAQIKSAKSLANGRRVMSHLKKEAMVRFLKILPATKSHRRSLTSTSSRHRSFKKVLHRPLPQPKSQTLASLNEERSTKSKYCSNSLVCSGKYLNACSCHSAPKVYWISSAKSGEERCAIPVEINHIVDNRVFRQSLPARNYSSIRCRSYQIYFEESRFYFYSTCDCESLPDQMIFPPDSRRARRWSVGYRVNSRLRLLVDRVSARLSSRLFVVRSSLPLPSHVHRLLPAHL